MRSVGQISSATLRPAVPGVPHAWHGARERCRGVPRRAAGGAVAVRVRRADLSAGAAEAAQTAAACPDRAAVRPAAAG
jgi:hypothetical protein